MFKTLSAAFFKPIRKGLRNCTRVAPDGLCGRQQRRMWLARAALLASPLWVQMASAKPASVGVTTPKPATVMVLGDSLSAEYGLARGEGWVALTEARMKALNWPVKVVNASLSGETTAGALSRLPALLKQYQPTHVVIELGANDALRGLSVNVARTQLGQLVALSQAAKARVVLVGMMAPPNLGKRYGDAFALMYADVAHEHSTGLVPFMLKGVADRADPHEWFQPDGLHPKAVAHPTIRDTIWPAWEASLLGR
jgi:acyl-CoA thioesterase-1